jgi:hypothetical protein
VHSFDASQHLGDPPMSAALRAVCCLFVKPDGFDGSVRMRETPTPPEMPTHVF